MTKQEAKALGAPALLKLVRELDNSRQYMAAKAMYDLALAVAQNRL